MSFTMSTYSARFMWSTIVKEAFIGFCSYRRQPGQRDSRFTQDLIQASQNACIQGRTVVFLASRHTQHWPSNMLPSSKSIGPPGVSGNAPSYCSMSVIRPYSSCSRDTATIDRLYSTAPARSVQTTSTLACYLSTKLFTLHGIEGGFGLKTS
jgi:hypothetical protein